MLNLEQRFRLRPDPTVGRIVRRTTIQGLTVCLKTYTNLLNFERSVSATQLLNHAAAPVPALLDWERTETHGFTLQTWWDGSSGDSIFAQLSHSQQHHLLHQIGYLHGTLQAVIPASTLRQATFWQRPAIFDSTAGYSWKTYLGAIAASSINRIQAALGADPYAIADDIERVRQSLESITEPAVLAIIHGDFVLRNVMFRPDLASIAGIIDWDLALMGDPVYDLAKITWADLDPRDHASRQALLAGWQTATGWSIDPQLFACYESIQAIAALAWIVKQPQSSPSLAQFRSLAVAALHHNRHKLG